MSKNPKTIKELIEILSEYDENYPVKIEVVDKNTHDYLSGSINDIYRGENPITEKETVFVRLEY